MVCNYWIFFLFPFSWSFSLWILVYKVSITLFSSSLIIFSAMSRLLMSTWKAFLLLFISSFFFFSLGISMSLLTLGIFSCTVSTYPLEPSVVICSCFSSWSDTSNTPPCLNLALMTALLLPIIFFFVSVFVPCNFLLKSAIVDQAII